MTDQPLDAANQAPAAERLEQTLFEVKKVIVGQDRTVERLLICLLARGHALLEGVPGLAKTLAAETIARVVGGSFTRIQFTPDLLPADVMGTRIYRADSHTFDVELGPVFANFVLADEINRAPAKVQSALLEVMAEHQVSIGGSTYPVPEPFLVLATQNPIEQEGVYPLPEAQRDRFLFKIVVDYPGIEEEVEIVQRMGVAPPVANRVIDPTVLTRLQGTASRVFVHHALVDYVVRLVVATRTGDLLSAHRASGGSAEAPSALHLQADQVAVEAHRPFQVDHAHHGVDELGHGKGVPVSDGVPCARRSGWRHSAT